MGTGLGVSCVKQHNNKSTVISGEGGYCHIPYPEKRRTSRDVINIIENNYPRVSSERLISGLGLTLIYEALTKINNITYIDTETTQLRGRVGRTEYGEVPDVKNFHNQKILKRNKPR